MTIALPHKMMAISGVTAGDAFYVAGGVVYNGTHFLIKDAVYKLSGADLATASWVQTHTLQKGVSYPAIVAVSDFLYL